MVPTGTFTSRSGTVGPALLLSPTVHSVAGTAMGMVLEPEQRDKAR